MIGSTNNNTNSTPEDGIWIGIDLGTSNSACAVWDSTRGSPKWIRLPPRIAGLESSGGKWGRLVPSLARFPDDGAPLVGAAALAEPMGSLVSSAKRLLGRRMSDLDPEWVKSLPYPLVEIDGELMLEVQYPAGRNQIVPSAVTPVEVLAALLGGIREGAEEYLDRFALRKRLEVPGEGLVKHVVIGVPAHFSKRQIGLVEEAARLGGFSGKVGTCMEATAAAMAYGLTLQETSKDATILVVDAGGGTTDLTVASRKRPRSTNEPPPVDDEDEDAPGSYRVLATLGDERLGGDDIDRAMMEHCLREARKQGAAAAASHDGCARLLRRCRDAKERLCDLESPSTSEAIRVDHDERDVSDPACKVEIDQDAFRGILEPWLDQARDLLRRVLEDLPRGTAISEVILVGGTSRIPAIRSMIQKEFFPGLELGTSLNPMSSVAQGLAIQAALLSKKVPEHELRSALMLDCIPHSIGVFVPSGGSTGSGGIDFAQGHFVEILKRNAPLPARGSATFGLADKLQPGITLHAVEKVGDALYEPMAKEPFTFLLRRLSEEEFRSMDSRTVEVGMKVDREGRFIVSIFDELDPEQVRKRERYFQQRRDPDTDQQPHGELGYISDLVFAESGFTSEQLMLLVVLLAMVALYVAVKLAFGEDQWVLGDDPDGTLASEEF